MPQVFCQRWALTETGEGSDYTRPDGCSLHITDEDRRTFINEYPRYKEYPIYPAIIISVSDDQYQLVQNGVHGIRCFDMSHL